jgi:hypothetical protein
MRTALELLPDVRVASPCPADWDAMPGTGAVRHSGQCGLNVYNLSALTTRQAADLIRDAEGRLCVRLYRRADGTVLTRDCPVGLRLRRLAWRALASSAAASLLAAGCGRPPSAAVPGDPPRVQWLTETDNYQVMGMVAPFTTSEQTETPNSSRSPE